jgi:hypothetical protein
MFLLDVSVFAVVADGSRTANLDEVPRHGQTHSSFVEVRPVGTQCFPAPFTGRDEEPHQL